MACKKHEDKLEGRSDPECEDCHLEDLAEMEYWYTLYQGEKQAGLIPDRDDDGGPEPIYRFDIRHRDLY
jgi:hypothetical protein